MLQQKELGNTFIGGVKLKGCQICCDGFAFYNAPESNGVTYDTEYRNNARTHDTSRNYEEIP